MKKEPLNDTELVQGSCISGISWPVRYQVMNSLCMHAAPDAKVGLGRSGLER